MNEIPKNLSMNVLPHTRGPKVMIAINPIPPPSSLTANPNLDDVTTINYNGNLYTVHATDLDLVRTLGAGAYGTVESMSVRDHPEITMAVKRLQFTVNEDERKTVEMDLQTIKSFGHHPNIVQFYGALFYEGDIWICMELMDISMDKFYKTSLQNKTGMPEIILQRLICAMVTALKFLKNNSIIHRDVKPSNMLTNRQVEFKLCDFGISGKLVDSVAKTFNKGCRPYFAPERIEPLGPYDTRSDVWSLGISIVEMANGYHPYHGTVFEMLKQITAGNIPQLPPHRYSDKLEDFVNKCLTKNVENRPNYADLMHHELFESLNPDVSTEEIKFVAEIIDDYQRQTGMENTYEF